MKHPGVRASRVGRLALVAVLALAGCDDAQQPEESPIVRPMLSAAIVSDPVAAFAGAAGLSLSGTDAASIVYVSLPPGTVPDAEQAAIRNPRTGSTLTVAMADGGFDPVAVEASAGDTLELDIRVADSDEALLYAIVVPGRRPPIVVRTDPPPKKRDVPLNATMLIVFSEPIAEGALTDSAIRLLRDGQPVAGRLAFGDAFSLTMTFTPTEPLAAGTDYALVVTQGVEDLDGERLAVPVTVEFTGDRPGTGTGAPEVGGSLAAGRWMVGDTITGQIWARSDLGLAWVGYRIGSPVVVQDSIMATGDSVDMTVTAVLPTEEGTYPVEVFARNSQGKLGYRAAPSLEVTTWPAGTFQSAAWPAIAGSGSPVYVPLDVAYDPNRDALYLLGSDGVAVLPLGTMAFDPLIPPPAETVPLALDLTAGGDSLLVLLKGPSDSALLGVVDLTAPGAGMSAVPVLADPQLGHGADLAVAANGKVYVAFHGAVAPAAAGGLVEFDLVTRTAIERGAVRDSGVAFGQISVLASGDRSRVFVRWIPSYPGLMDLGEVYDVAADTFGSVRSFPFRAGVGYLATVDQSGGRFFVLGELYDGSLTQIAYFDYPFGEPLFYGDEMIDDHVYGVISPDGSLGYFGQLIGVWPTFETAIAVVSLADNVVRERFRLPGAAVPLLVLPDGGRLIAMNATDLLVVRLR